MVHVYQQGLSGFGSYTYYQTGANVRVYVIDTGTCVDLFAPGHALTAASPTNATQSTTYGGTSGAAPHVAGVAALRMELEPGLTPATVEARIKGYATRDRLTNIGAGSPSLLLYSFVRKTRACCS